LIHLIEVFNISEYGIFCVQLTRSFPIFWITDYSSV